VRNSSFDRYRKPKLIQGKLKCLRLINLQLPQFAAVYGALSGAFISLVSPAIISISDDISEIG
jgi:hypothetical protein